MGEQRESEISIRSDIKDFQKRFGNVVKLLDRSAEGFIFGRSSRALAALREELGEDAAAFEAANRNVEEFRLAQLAGRDMSGYGPISANAAELIFEASKEDLMLPGAYPEGNYLMYWKSKSLTGFITGSNPKDVATWRYELSYEPGSFRHPSVSIQWETDWTDWNKFKGQAHQNYPLETITRELDVRQEEPWQLTEPEILTIAAMTRFAQKGRLREIQSTGDSIAAAIMGASGAVVNEALGQDPEEVFIRLINEFNSKRE